ncbi:MAG: S9 family peptidase [Balneolaceae bacterium]|nr:S9 family peptidase [Balneolaceae bacterium]
MQRLSAVLLLVLLAATAAPPDTQAWQVPPGQTGLFNLENVFDLEYVTDPRISPSGGQVVYVRNSMDIRRDRRSSSLWTVNADGSRHRPLTDGDGSQYYPRWSPDGNRLLYVSSTEDEGSEMFIRWMDTGEAVQITHLEESPGSPSWSPDGSMIAFTMFVPGPDPPMVTLPGKPEGAEWAEPARVIDRLQYRADGAGYTEKGYTHLFVVPSTGGTPRQLTTGDYNHSGTPRWSPDGNHIYLSGNRRDNPEEEPSNTEVYRVRISDGQIYALTSRLGPDSNPVPSPDGQYIAYTGYDEEYLGYQQNDLYIMNADGSGKRLLTDTFDRSVSNPQWSQSRNGLFVQYDDQGRTILAFVSMSGQVRELVDDLGGTSLGRPYSSGSYSVSPGGAFAYTRSRPDRPSELGLGSYGGSGGGGQDAGARTLTGVNEDLFGNKQLGDVEEIWYESTHDGREIQGWIVKPPNFDPARDYPMILEIHGGPFAAYGPHFSAEVQLYATAGYVVLYTNPRGSSSYGREFGNLIHHNYPSEDYEDLMSGVDAMVERGYVDSDRLYITGGSGGGVLTAWSIGKTDRFRAAVVAKPVINWYSFVLTADGPSFFYRWWFPGYPWEHRDHYMDRSPISLVGNVTTPTMLLTGEEDYRTPISETEQYYTALKLQGVESVMVRIPGSGHGIASRPSQLMTKVAHILTWFEDH